MDFKVSSSRRSKGKIVVQCMETVVDGSIDGDISRVKMGMGFVKEVHPPKHLELRLFEKECFLFP